MFPKDWVGPTKGTWRKYGDMRTCSILDHNANWNLANCKVACEANPKCTAIQMHHTSGYSCYILKCPYPVPPTDEFIYSPNWVGYYRAG